MIAGVDDFLELVHVIEAGDYQPSPGSVGARLVEVWPERRRLDGVSALADFARLAVSREGLWWAMVLSTDPDMVAEEEAEYVAWSWRTWADGRTPFRRSSRVVRRRS